MASKKILIAPGGTKVDTRLDGRGYSGPSSGELGDATRAETLRTPILVAAAGLTLWGSCDTVNASTVT